jgi:2,4-dienoyl-CoA reductase-like NADH-dependent reductase (Old Yellow Enzyme family)
LNGASQGTDDSDPASLSAAVAQALEPIGLAFVEMREQRPDGTRGASDVPRQSPIVRRYFSGPLVLNSDYDVARAQEDLASGLAQAISFGRPFISNPVLPDRFSVGAPLAPLSEGTLYTQGAEGYVDYPVLAKAG